MAAALLGAARGVKPAAIAKAFKSFKGVEHRIEDCGTIKGLRCFNDSKGTNVDSTLAALESLGTPEYLPKGGEKAILLVLGGLPKGGGFRALRPLVEKYVKAVLTIGSAARSIEEDLQGVTHVFPCEDLETAVKVAFQVGQKGELLLLSPACASFDQFKDFEDRGRRFKEYLKKAGKGA
jgi:UDP-N-acetylmuramoylalanine--D-glutamate ligase